MIRKLDEAIKAVAPVYGVSVGRKDDKATWRVDFKDEATQAEKDAAQVVIDGFDVDADFSPTKDEIYDQTLQNNALIRGIVKSINDGTLVTGAGKTGAQLKAIIKANM